MDDLISVIVPIYNVENYLEKCVDSILKQTYTNLEIILVDDGSTDKCGIICDKYKLESERIQVIHKKNGGLSDARNIGIEKANGKYIIFVDSDDFIVDNAIENLYKNIIKYGKDISIGQIETFSDEKNIKKIERKVQTFCYDNQDAMENLLYNTQYTSSTAGKLFSKKIFDNIKFPVGKKYEDLATVYKLIHVSNGVVVTNQIVYEYFTARSGSIMNENFKLSRLDALYFTEEILDFINENYPMIKNAAIARLIIECRDILVEIPNDNEFKKYKEYINKYIKKYKFKVIFDKKLPLLRRISLFPILFGNKAIILCWKLKNKLKK